MAGLILANVERQGEEVVRARRGKNAAHIMRAVPAVLGSFDVVGVCAVVVGRSNDDTIVMGDDVTDGTMCKRCDAIYTRLVAASETGPDTREETVADTFVAELFAPEIGTDGKPWTPGDNPARRDPAYVDDAPAPITVPTLPAPAPAPAVDRAALIAAEKARRTDRAERKAARESGSAKPVKRAARKPAVRLAVQTEIPGWTEIPVTGGGTEAERRAAAVAAFYAAGNPVPSEVASLPDPTVARSAWSGTAGASDGGIMVCEYRNHGPVDGSDDDGVSGKCPECRGMITLSDKGMIPTHNVYGVASPAGKGLTSKSVDAVEHGTVPGSPADADKRRAVEAQCVRSGKILKGADGDAGRNILCPDCARPVELKARVRKNGTSWMIPSHTRPGTSYRAGGGDAGYVKGADRNVSPRGEGRDLLMNAREHGSVAGSANTGEVNMPPVQPKRGWLATAGTGSLPATVMPGIDSGVAGKYCPVCLDLVEIAHAGKGRAWRRKHSKRVAAWHAERDAERETKRRREIAAGLAIPAALRRELRKAASIGSRMDGTNASTGTVTHAVTVGA